MNRVSIKTGLQWLTACWLSLLFAGCSGKNVYAPPPPPSVTVEPAEQKDTLVYTQFPGYIEAVNKAKITARVKGYLQSIDFEDGQIVTNGQRLFLIQPEQYQAARDSAAAGLEKSKAMLKLAEMSHKRMAEAFKTRAVSEIDLLNAEANMHSAAADVLVAEAALEAAELNLSYTTVKASMDGRVSRHLVSVGNLVGGGGEPTLLTTLLPLDPMYVYFNIDERSMLIFQDLEKKPTAKDTSLKVEIELAHGERYPEEGHVDYVATELDQHTGTLEIRAIFPNPDGTLLAGQFARVMIPRTIKDAVLIPSLTVQRDIAGDFVLTVNEKNRVIRKEIKPGPLAGADRRIIFEGINPGELIVVEGLQNARVGIEVNTETKESAPAKNP